MLSVEGVSKRYGKRWVNRSLTFSVSPGEIVALHGANGAGKTTLVRQIAGLVTPSEGAIWVGRREDRISPRRGRSLIAYQPQAQIALESLTPFEAVALAGELRGLSPTSAKGAAAGILSDLDIEQWKTIPGHKLSGGLRRLVAFGMTLNSAARLVILDEPTNDVDPERRTLIWRALRERFREAAVLVVTHNVHEASLLADRALTLTAGALTPRSAGGAIDSAETKSGRESEDAEE